MPEDSELERGRERLERYADDPELAELLARTAPLVGREEPSFLGLAELARRRTADTYCNVLAVCAGAREPRELAYVPGPQDQLTPQSRAHVMTVLAWASVTGDEQAREPFFAHNDAAGAAAALPANRLRMPLRATTAVLDAAVVDAAPRLHRAVDELLSRIDEVFGAAMLDRYHWRRMMSRVMSAEPEVVAPLAVAVAAGYSPEQARDRHDRPARVALEVAASIAEAPG